MQKEGRRKKEEGRRKREEDLTAEGAEGAEREKGRRKVCDLCFSGCLELRYGL
ncbi:MAG: hypothetical protein ABI262_04295 [Microcoleus sp.]